MYMKSRDGLAKFLIDTRADMSIITSFEIKNKFNKNSRNNKLIFWIKRYGRISNFRWSLRGHFKNLCMLFRHRTWRPVRNRLSLKYKCLTDLKNWEVHMKYRTRNVYRCPQPRCAETTQMLDQDIMNYTFLHFRRRCLGLTNLISRKAFQDQTFISIFSIDLFCSFS